MRSDQPRSAALEIVCHAQRHLGTRLAAHHRPDQMRQHLTELKSAIETIGRFGQISPCTPGLTDGVVAPADGAFDLGRHHIDPARPSLLRLRATFDFEDGMCMPRISKAELRRLRRGQPCRPCAAIKQATRFRLTGLPSATRSSCIRGAPSTPRLSSCSSPIYSATTLATEVAAPEILQEECPAPEH